MVVEGFEVIMMYGQSLVVDMQSEVVDVQSEVVVVDVRTLLGNHPCGGATCVGDGERVYDDDVVCEVDINWRFDADSYGFLLKCVELVFDELVMMLKFLEKDYGVTKERIDSCFQPMREEMIIEHDSDACIYRICVHINTDDILFENEFPIFDIEKKLVMWVIWDEKCDQNEVEDDDYKVKVV
ncbi:hypothetical protein Tco_0861169 [Tanacetum coccineum]|uniref:Uncharacterized protein n=1 Tax=Tanacetum coccineum TaxID=301880 RepID=A0ABQ5BK31_9ASTR